MSKRFLIDNRKLIVADGLLAPEESVLYPNALDQAAFTRTEIASPESAETKHFVSKMSLEALQHVPLLSLTLRLLGLEFPGVFRPYRAYTNLALSGDMLYSHFDCLPEHDEVTALWYLCRRWHHDWSGETVFFDQAHEIAASVVPRPGRLVLFDGRIRHAGRPPTRIAEEARYTFAIKFQRAL